MSRSLWPGSRSERPPCRVLNVVRGGESSRRRLAKVADEPGCLAGKSLRAPAVPLAVEFLELLFGVKGE